MQIGLQLVATSLPWKRGDVFSTTDWLFRYDASREFANKSGASGEIWAGALACMIGLFELLDSEAEKRNFVAYMGRSQNPNVALLRPLILRKIRAIEHDTKLLKSLNIPAQAEMILLKWAEDEVSLF